MAITFTKTGSPTVNTLPSVYVGSAYEFNGNSANYVDLSSNPDWNLSGKNFTISFWAKLNSNALFQAIIGNWDSVSNNRQFIISFLASTSILRLYVSPVGVAGGDTIFDASNAIAVGDWGLYTITYNSTTFLTKIYINGELSASATKTSLFSANKTAIGRYSTVTATSPFNGSIADLKLDHRELTAEEVKYEYLKYAPTIADITSPIVHYDMSIGDNIVKVFNGSSTKVVMPSKYNLNQVEGTWSCRFKANNNSRGCLFGDWKANTTQRSWMVQVDQTQNLIRLTVTSAGNGTPAQNIAFTYDENWHDLELTKIGNIWTLVYDGVSASTSAITAFVPTAGDPAIGYFVDGAGGNQYFNGYIEDLKFNGEPISEIVSLPSVYKLLDNQDTHPAYLSTNTQVDGRRDLTGLIQGNALTFNGTAGQIIPLSTSSTLNMYGKPFSFSIWLQPTNASGGAGQSPIGSWFNPSNKMWNIWHIGTNISMYFSANGSANGAISTIIPTVVAGTWYHIVCTFDGTTATTYLNSTKVASFAATMFNGVSKPCLGGLADLTYPYTGKLDEVKIFGHVLSELEVKSLYENKTSTTIPSFQSVPRPTSSYLAYGPSSKAVEFNKITQSYLQNTLRTILDIGENVTVTSPSSGVYEIEFDKKLSGRKLIQDLTTETLALSAGTWSLEKIQDGGTVDVFTTEVKHPVASGHTEYRPNSTQRLLVSSGLLSALDNNFCFAFQVRTSNVAQTNADVVNFISSGNGGSGGVTVRFNASTLAFSVYNNGASLTTGSVSVVGKANTWLNCLFIWRNKRVQLWVDGVSTAETAVSSPLSTGADYITFGSNAGASNWCNCDLRNVAFFNGTPPNPSELNFGKVHFGLKQVDPLYDYWYTEGKFATPTTVVGTVTPVVGATDIEVTESEIGFIQLLIDGVDKTNDPAYKIVTDELNKVHVYKTTSGTLVASESIKIVVWNNLA